MKKGSTLLLRFAVICATALVLALCVFVLPVGLRSDNVGGYRPIILGMYVTVIPFLIAVYQTFRLLGHLDANKAFSTLSVNALGAIKACALVIGGIYAAGMPYIYIVADRDDAPGVVAIGLLFSFASLVIATLAALLQRILSDAIALKSENDLTV